jgi:hypothetical protein
MEKAWVSMTYRNREVTERLKVALDKLVKIARGLECVRRRGISVIKLDRSDL